MASIIAEGDEETAPGWLKDAPLEIWATGKTRTADCPWQKLTVDQVAKLVSIKPWATDEEGNVTINEIYKPIEFTG